MENGITEDGNNIIIAENNWIITDLRFPNELEAIKKRNGLTIRINRPGLEENNHISETALDNADFDYVIDNNTSLKALINSVYYILKKENLI
jgi:hypothetical protein